jgi:transcriptional regulator with XRE-family HTH domain
MTTQEPTSAPERFLRLLKKALGGSGLSLRAAAGKAAVSPSYLSRLLKGERGLPSNETIGRLEEVLDVQPRGLLFDAAGRQDRLLAEVLHKDSQRLLMRSLAPLSRDEFAKVIGVAEKLAKKYHGR